MARKIETENSPQGFYDEDTIPKRKKAVYYFALDKNASASDIERVKLMSQLNIILDQIELNATNKRIAEILKVDASVISRVRKYRYEKMAQDVLWRLLTDAMVITEKRNLTGAEVYSQVMGEIQQSSAIA